MLNWKAVLVVFLVLVVIDVIRASLRANDRADQTSWAAEFLDALFDFCWIEWIFGDDDPFDHHDHH